MRAVLRLVGCLLAIGCATNAGVANLQLPATAPKSPIPLEAFAASPRLENLKLSPNGRYVASVRLVGGYRNLVKTDLDTGKTTPITGFTDDFLFNFWWANDERLLLSRSSDDNSRRRLYAIDSDGTDPLDFTDRENPLAPPPRAITAQYGDMIVSLSSDSKDSVLVAYTYGVRPNWIASEVYRLNINSGSSTLVVRSKENPFLWFASDDGEIRIGAGLNEGQTFFVYRESRGDDWERVGPEQPSPVTQSRFVVLGISQDPDKVYVRSRHEGDRFSLYLYDIRTGEFSKPLFSHPWADVEGPMLYAASKPGQPPRAIGVSYVDHFVRIHWLDPEWQALSDTIDASLPGTINTIVSKSGDDQRVIVLARSDRDAGTYYLYKRPEKQLIALSKVRPELSADTMVEVEPVRYTARDGLEIQGYLVLPRGSEGQRVPIVVSAHGGGDPVLFLYSRATQEFDPEAQLLASRGWGVFRPNFRGSKGLGLDLQKRGDKQWGRAVQNDIVDGVRWLIESGVADPAKICLLGRELGGHASIEGLIQNPELFACGAALNAVYDFDRFLGDQEFFFNKGIIDAQIGDAELLAAVSPRSRAAQIQDPVLLAHSTENRLFKPEQAKNMAKALDAAGKPNHLVLLDDSVEASSGDALRLRYYRNLEAFFYQNLGAGPTPPPAVSK